MEKEEESKFASTHNLELEINGVLSNNEKSVFDGTDRARNAKSGCHFVENGACQNQQYTELLRRAHNPQNAEEKSSPSAASAAVNEGLQSLQNLANLQHQRSPPQQFVFSSQPLWVQPQPSTSIGGSECNWQAPAGFGAGASLSCQPQAPNFCYPVGFPTYPRFPGTWDASMWWGQTQPLLYPGMSSYPRASSYGFGSPQSWPMTIPSCVTSTSGQPLLRGVIKPPEKLSQKHQRLWEAQSAENVQLWNMIGQLQGELADCKGRLVKLEAGISSLRPAAADEPAVENGGVIVRGQPTKRGSSKRAIAPVGSEPSLQLRTRGRKPARRLTKVEAAKLCVNDQESLNKVDDKENDLTSLNITEQDKNEGVSATIIQNNGITEIDDGTLKIPVSLGNQVLHQFPKIQSCGIESKSPSLLKPNYEGIISEDSNGNVKRQRITRWDFEDEDEAVKSRFPAVGHRKENEEMTDEFSSRLQEIEAQNGSSWCGK